MTQAGILRQSYASPKDEEAVYTALLPIDKLTVGTMVDRLEAHGKWEIDLPLDRLCKGEYWNKAIGLRHDYLQNLKSVSIRNLDVFLMGE
ncbi:MAG: hypothetical protein IKX69_02575, partial [Prevotella sp.]|nr:hypothetical protein [Prevotella sp.]